MNSCLAGERIGGPSSSFRGCWKNYCSLIDSVPSDIRVVSFRLAYAVEYISASCRH